MQLQFIDWLIIGAFFVVSLIVGVLTSRRSGSTSAEFFLSGRSMPWWLLGVSMVATTFSADTPNLVADIVRQNGVSGNWVWWAFLITGMLTVFVYARLWRRSGILTDIEFYELRYSGKEAAFLRGFRALYLGVFFNVVIMATVCLAAVKIGSILLGIPPWKTLLIASIITVFYSALGGFRGVVLTDFVQFLFAMGGSVAAAYYVINLPEVGGLESLIASPAVADKLNFIPELSNRDLFFSVFLIPLAVQWWSVWYPGAEPGGGGYIAQRMLSAKNEKHALAATLLFNVAHYALRPWPWILVALASLVVFPEISDLRTAFPNVDPSVVGHDLAYPAMLSYLPAGLLGLVVASLIAAFMSTISTHLNWGSSYVVNDFYVRFVNPNASDRQQVNVGRITTVLLMVAAALLSYAIGSAKQGFQVLLQIGAGTGLIFILRWFWMRINAYAEIAGMVVSFLFALSMLFIDHQLDDWMVLCLGVAVTTIGWLSVMYLTPATDDAQLKVFYERIRPAGRMWRTKFGALPKNIEDGVALPMQILSVFIGTVLVYAALFATGQVLYGNSRAAMLLYALAAVCSLWLAFIWRKRA
jgi:SSS family solute:Na+ symporter